MEQLQRQQEAKLEMNLQEKHLLQAQLRFAQHATAARAASSKLDARLFGRADGQMYQCLPKVLNNHLSRIDPGEEDEDSEDEEQEEMVENDEMDDDDEEEEENEIHRQQKKPELQQVPGFPLPPYRMFQPPGMKQISETSPSEIKQEHEEKDLTSSAGQQSFTSPSRFSDWGCDEPFKQVSLTLTLQQKPLYALMLVSSSETYILWYICPLLCVMSLEMINIWGPGV